MILILHGNYYGDNGTHSLPQLQLPLLVGGTTRRGKDMTLFWRCSASPPKSSGSCHLRWPKISSYGKRGTRVAFGRDGSPRFQSSMSQPGLWFNRSANFSCRVAQVLLRETTLQNKSSRKDYLIAILISFLEYPGVGQLFVVSWVKLDSQRKASFVGFMVQVILLWVLQFPEVGVQEYVAMFHSSSSWSLICRDTGWPCRRNDAIDWTRSFRAIASFGLSGELQLQSPAIVSKWKKHSHTIAMDIVGCLCILKSLSVVGVNVKHARNTWNSSLSEKKNSINYERTSWSLLWRHPMFSSVPTLQNLVDTGSSSVKMRHLIWLSMDWM